jgi:hypothetical protein
VGIRCRDHATPSIRKKLALTSTTSVGCSVGIVHLRTKATEFNFFFFTRSFLCASWHMPLLPWSSRFPAVCNSYSGMVWLYVCVFWLAAPTISRLINVIYTCATNAVPLVLQSLGNAKVIFQLFRKPVRYRTPKSVVRQPATVKREWDAQKCIRIKEEPKKEGKL